MDHPSPKRILSLDFCRAFAALWVVLYHYPHLPTIPGLSQIAGWGALGVDLFFVLSGYLIAEQFLKNLSRSPSTGLALGEFFFRRTLRIWPNYFAMIALFLSFKVLNERIEPLFNYLTFTQNFSIPNGFGPSWSLCIEEHFYLLFPLIAVIVMKSRNRRLPGFVFFSIFLGGLLLRGALWLRLRPDVLATTSSAAASAVFYRYFYFPTWSRLDGLTLGVLLATLKLFQPGTWKRITGFGNGALAGFGLLAVFAIAIGSNRVRMLLPAAFCAVGSPSSYGFMPMVFGDLAWAIAFGALLIAALSPRSLLARAKMPGITSLALLSYAIYLSHEAAFKIVALLFPNPLSPGGEVGRMVLNLGAVLVLAKILYVGVEKPFMTIRDRALASWNEKRRALASPASCA